MDNYLIFSIIVLGLAVMFCMIRVILGPTKGDRIIGINVIGTKTMVIIAMVSFILKETYFIDVVIVYALISFIGSYVVAREIAESDGGESYD